MLTPPSARPLAAWFTQVGWGALLAACALTACSDDGKSDASSSGGSGGEAETGGKTGSGGAVVATGATSSGGSATGGGSDGGTGGATATHGHVDLVPYYEAGSAWESNQAARAMVDALFAEVEDVLRTSGSWDATIEVYLTDDDSVTANTYFDDWAPPATVDGQTVLVVPAWAEVVLGAEDQNGTADDAGNGFEFAVAFNVTDHAENAGLLRHEVMHGLGAVNAIPYPTMSSANDALGGLVPGSWVTAALYDLALTDRQGKPLLGNYDAETRKYQVQTYDVEPTFDEWTDGYAGLSFRGISDSGESFDMQLETAPDGADAVLMLNEPSTLMSANAHPSWAHIAEPDRAFFRAMRYELAP